MDLEQQLHEALAPVRPAPQVRAVVMARLSAKSRPGRGRWLMGIGALGLAAAAAMVALQTARPVAAVATVDAKPADPQREVNIQEQEVVLPDDATVRIVAEPGRQPAGRVADPPPADRFVVQVLALEFQDADSQHREEIEAVYAAFVEGLRQIPGARIQVGDSAEKDAAAPALPTFRLVLRGGNSGSSSASTNSYVVRVEAQRFSRDGTPVGNLGTSAIGQSAPGCITALPIDVLAEAPCADPAGVAGQLLGLLSRVAFPPDPQIERRLKDRLVAQDRDATERLRALAQLASIGRATGRTPDRASEGLRDPEVVQAAIQLTTIAADPAIRGEVWYTLRGVGSPELVLPLLTAVRSDSDLDTRAQALETLAADFQDDPRARALLEEVASGEANPMMRALARKALGDRAAWTDHVVSSLKDSTRPSLERIEAFFHAYGVVSRHNYGSFSPDGRILQALDDAAINALAEVLPRAVAESQRYEHASITLMSQLATLDRPAVTELMLSALANDGPGLTRGIAIEAVSGRVADPRVRRALEEIAATDPSQQLREQAARALRNERQSSGAAQSGASHASVASPPRLGVTTDYVKAAPGVPADLVGKLAITQMGTGAPADRAGLKVGDILLEIDGKAIVSGRQLIEVLDGLERDVNVDVMISRAGQHMRITARF